MDKEGIFRKSPSSEELQSVKAAFNNGKSPGFKLYVCHTKPDYVLTGMAVDLNQHSIEVSAALLKVFIRDLPTPLIDLKFSASMGALPGKLKP